MNELKPEDVMRALECHIKRRCAVCPLHEEEIMQLNPSCGTMIAELALALLREKGVEIKRLTEERDKAQAICVQMGKLNQAEIAKARADAITEFAEETIEWCRKKLKFGKYQTMGLSGKRLEGYEAAMRAVMSYMHSLKSKDDFPNCKISGCEAARKDCHIGCPYGKENTDDSGTKI